MFFPQVGTYAEPSSKCNTVHLNLGNISLYYSYRTIIAFHTIDEGLVVCSNEWGPTTARHLNLIDGGNVEDRIDYDEFQDKLYSALERYYGNASTYKD